MDIKILAIGSLDKKYLIMGCETFFERIKHYAKLEIIELKEVNNKNEQVTINEQKALVIKKTIRLFRILYCVDTSSKFVSLVRLIITLFKINATIF
ncbi:MAG: hypothetical protein SPLM_02440 [Spiroplasma phoeniceum]|uniref:23S rRNA (pseudouridine(1915)-N(3))-methyltransferase RlmH n=1 Tax=Spiroplasma phoeniceum TaxID=47835 RepID=UPI00326CB069